MRKSCSASTPPFHAPTVEIQKIMACGVDDEGLENIFYHNAAKFMGLK